MPSTLGFKITLVHQCEQAHPGRSARGAQPCHSRSIPRIKPAPLYVCRMTRGHQSETRPGLAERGYGSPSAFAVLLRPVEIRREKRAVRAGRCYFLGPPGSESGESGGATSGTRLERC